MTTRTRLTAVGHAAHVLAEGHTVLLIDPWLAGAAFDDGWEQYTRPVLDPALRDRLTQVWISHEHPDHFSPASLRALPGEIRARCTVLFQDTVDGRVVDLCRRIGFGEVTTMPDRTWVDIGELSAMCVQHDHGDSYLAVRTAQGVVVNLNDCVIARRGDIADVGRLVGERPRLLLTQFSYANKVGGPDDTMARRRAATEVLDRLVAQADGLPPEVIVPSASFVWFCHEENDYLNDAITPVSRAVARIVEDTGADPLVLTPGDTWDLATRPPSPDDAVARYDADLERARRTGTRRRSAARSLAELIELGGVFADDLVAANGRFTLRLLGAIGYLRPIRVALTDLGLTVTIGVDGVEMSPAHSADLSASSAAIDYLLRHPYGGSALMSSGRFTAVAGGSPSRFYRLVRLRDINNAGGTARGLMSFRLRRKARNLRALLTPRRAPAGRIRSATTR
ncbi:MAG: MBL fold metallo-hydrolase [Desertimonas sp.]